MDRRLSKLQKKPSKSNQIFDLHEKFSHSLEQDTQLHFIKRWGHRHDQHLVDCHVKVISYTTDEKPKTYNLEDGHSALIILAEQYVADKNNAVSSALDDTVAKPMEMN